MRESSMPAQASGRPERQLLEELARAIDPQPGSRREGVRFLLEEVSGSMSTLYLGPAEALPSLEAQEKLRAKLAKTLDQLEDILEAMELATPADGRAAEGGSRGGR